MDRYWLLADRDFAGQRIVRLSNACEYDRRPDENIIGNGPNNIRPEFYVFHVVFEVVHKMQLRLFDVVTGESSGRRLTCRLADPKLDSSPTPKQCTACTSTTTFRCLWSSTMAHEGANDGDADVQNAHVADDDSPEDLSQDEKQKAAAVIQRNYRGYRERRQMKGLGLSASTRWSEAMRDVQYRRRTRLMSRDEALATGDAQTRARMNWQRFGAIAARAAEDDSSDDDTESEDRDRPPSDFAEQRRRRSEAKIERTKNAKQMDLQYWLEMVDPEHRYGSHLRTYHEAWKEADTHENFFYWLDHGEGKDLDLPLVSRQKLDSDKVRYLSREERQNYLVRIDKEGRLCWAHNGIRITTSTAYKDSVDGIVPRTDVEHRPWALPVEEPGTFTSDESDTMSTGHIDDEEGQHYVNHELRQAKGVKKLKHVSAATIFNHLLQSTVKPNSWIFVADTSFRLYVGIKQSGSFQHSSFLRGSRISAAGLIKIKEGQLRKLSPLSGHYRPPTKNFRLFVHALKDAGVDMSHVSISQSYAILVGLEAYVRTRRKIKHGVQHAEDGAEKVIHPEEARAKKEAQMDNSESAKKERLFLERQETKQKEQKKRNSLSYRIFSKFRSRTSKAHNEEGSANPVRNEPPVHNPDAPHSSEHEDPETGIPPAGSR